jgi:hypothetical protein
VQNYTIFAPNQKPIIIKNLNMKKNDFFFDKQMNELEKPLAEIENKKGWQQ